MTGFGPPGDERGPTDAPASSSHDLSEPSLEELRAELEDARGLLAEAEERFLRARADLDNYRKRAVRELERRVDEQRDALLLDWLQVVDSVERALALELEQPQLAEGLRAVLEQIESILARQGVTRIGAVGEPFDPELHEAVTVVPSVDHEPGMILDVVRSGYLVGERLLRPAQVAVVRGPRAGD